MGLQNWCQLSGLQAPESRKSSRLQHGTRRAIRPMLLGDGNGLSSCLGFWLPTCKFINIAGTSIRSASLSSRDVISM